MFCTRCLGVTELLQLSFSAAESEWLPPLMRTAAAVGQGGSAEGQHSLVGCFRSVVGPANTAVLLVHHASQDALLEAAETRRTDAACKQTHRCTEKIRTIYSAVVRLLVVSCTKVTR